MNLADDSAKTRLTRGVLCLIASVLFWSIAALHSLAAEQSPVRLNEAEVWTEIAYVRFQAAQGYDSQSDIRKLAAFKPKGPQEPATPGSELELAGDEKSLACDEYQKAAQHWGKATQGFKSAIQLDKAKITKDSAGVSWLAARRTIFEAIELYRMAEEIYETANDLPKKSAVLGKIAANLEWLIEIDANISSNSVS